MENKGEGSSRLFAAKAAEPSSNSLTPEALSEWKPKGPENSSLSKQKAPAPKKREVKKKPPNPKALKKPSVQFDRGESFAPGQDELEELVRTAGARMPGKFGDGNLLVRDPDEDPAMRFVLKKKPSSKKISTSPSLTKRTFISAGPKSSVVSADAHKDSSVARTAPAAIDRSKVGLLSAGCRKFS